MDTPSRKEREKLARQQEIVRAARDLFIQKGYRDTKLEEIAQHAEFGKGTIYNYFASKRELFTGILNSLLDEVEELARQAVETSEGGAREKFTAYARAMISYSNANSDLFHFLMRELVQVDSESDKNDLFQMKERVQKTWKILAGPLEEEVQAGRVRPFNVERLAGLFDSMLRFYGMHFFSRENVLTQAQVEEASRLIVSVLFDGIAVRTVKEQGNA